MDDPRVLRKGAVVHVDYRHALDKVKLPDGRLHEIDVRWLRTTQWGFEVMVRLRQRRITAKDMDGTRGHPLPPGKGRAGRRPVRGDKKGNRSAKCVINKSPMNWKLLRSKVPRTTRASVARSCSAEAPYFLFINQ